MPLPRGKDRCPEHQRSVLQCWACTADGEPCPRKPKADGARDSNNGCTLAGYIPYCAHHLRHGDEIVKALPHPTKAGTVGKILVATKDIPAGYKFVYWGSRAKNTVKFMDDDDRAITYQYGEAVAGVIDPGPHKGSVLQFAASPGPDEFPNMMATEKCLGERNSAIVGCVYEVVHPVKAGAQVAHDYGLSWFKERKITPENVGTPDYVMPRRLSRHLKMNWSGSYSAALRQDGKTRTLGTFWSQEEAFRAVKAAESAPRKRARGASEPRKRLRR